MPTASDLVTDLPADFEVFGQAVDTSLADLKGGTTGQVLKKNTNADMDFVWAADAAGMTNPMTTTGDTIYSSSGSTPARLGIGTTGQVLTVAGGVPTWATASGGMTLLATTSLTGASTTINSFSGYTSLVFYVTNMTNATNSYGFSAQPNASTTICSGTGTENAAVSTFTNAPLQFNSAVNVNRTDTNFAMTLKVDNYASTSSWKPFEVYGYYKGTDTDRQANMAGIIKTNSAITSMVFVAAGGDFTGGTILTYGVK